MLLLLGIAALQRMVALVMAHGTRHKKTEDCRRCSCVLCMARVHPRWITNNTNRQQSIQLQATDNYLGHCHGGGGARPRPQTGRLALRPAGFLARMHRASLRVPHFSLLRDAAVAHAAEVPRAADDVDRQAGVHVGAARLHARHLPAQVQRAVQRERLRVALEGHAREDAAVADARHTDGQARDGELRDLGARADGLGVAEAGVRLVDGEAAGGKVGWLVGWLSRIVVARL